MNFQRDMFSLMYLTCTHVTQRADKEMLTHLYFRAPHLVLIILSRSCVTGRDGPGHVLGSKRNSVQWEQMTYIPKSFWGQWLSGLCIGIIWEALKYAKTCVLQPRDSHVTDLGSTHFKSSTGYLNVLISLKTTIPGKGTHRSSGKVIKYLILGYSF